MIQVFDQAPARIQTAPHDPRIIAAGYQISVREINFNGVHDKDTLMVAFSQGMCLSERFGCNWDALYDVLTDPEARPAKLALILYNYVEFKRRHGKLAKELESVLLDAQTNAAENQRQLWLLAEESVIDPKHW